MRFLSLIVFSGVVACSSSGSSGNGSPDSGTGGAAGGGGTGAVGATGGSAGTSTGGSGGSGNLSGNFGPAEMLIDNQTATFRIALGGGSVFWASRGAPLSTETGSLQSIPQAGGAATTVDTGNILALRTSTDSVFWANGDANTIFAKGLDGSPKYVVTPAEQVADVVIAGGDLYWTAAGGDGSPFNRVSLPGGVPVPLVSQSTASATPFFYMTADDSDVYMVTSSNSNLTLYFLSLSEAMGAQFADLGSNLPLLALDANYLYTASAAGVARYVRVPDSPPEPLGSLPGSYGIAVDADAAYVTTYTDPCNAADGIVYRIPFSTMIPTPIAQGQTCPNGIAVDASGVYWVNTGILQGSTYLTGTGQVMKAPRI